MILPRVKTKQYNQDYFLSDALIFPEGNEASHDAIKIISVLSPNSSCKVGISANVFFEQKDSMTKGEYSLTVLKEKIKLCFGEYEGMRNSLVSLIQLNQGGKIPCIEISDCPDNEFRSCMLDLARGYVEITLLREHIARLAMLKFNFVHFHLMDRQSYCLESSVIPNENQHRLYSKSEMKEIVQFCKMLGLTAIPEIEVPAHAVNLLQELPQMKCSIINDETKPSDWVVCAGKESTYCLYKGIISEITDIFDGEYFHIGGDEMEFRNLGWYPNWDNCYECRALAERENLRSQTEIYYYVIRRINDIVKSFGKKTIMWNDNINLSQFPSIPTDIIIDFWHPRKLETAQEKLNALLNYGYKVINAQYQYTYVDLPDYMNEEKIKAWVPYNEKQKYGVMGGEMCAWELGNPLYSYYPYTLPVCMTLFSDRLWNTNMTEYNKDYRISVFNSITGDFSKEIDPYILFDELIPPRVNDLLEHIDFDKFNLSIANEVLSSLRNINVKVIYGVKALNEMICCVEKIIEHMEEIS